MTPDDLLRRLELMDRRDELIRREWGKAIRAQRELLGYSRRHIAEQLGVSVQTVGYWENGRSAPRPALQVDLARALNVQHSILFRISA